MNPEFYGYVQDRLLAAGALDVYIAPLMMKKGRPAALLSALCRPEKANALCTIILDETTTMGVRSRKVTRFCLPRTSKEVDTPFGPVRVKVARWKGGSDKMAPEYEDCRRAAETHGVPLRVVYEAVWQAGPWQE